MDNTKYVLSHAYVLSRYNLMCHLAIDKQIQYSIIWLAPLVISSDIFMYVCICMYKSYLYQIFLKHHSIPICKKIKLKLLIN